MKTLLQNRRVRFEYEILESVEAGLVLQGWEVKSLRAGRGQITDSFVVRSKDALYLLNAHITPLTSASTHVDANPTRSRKLLLHKKESDRLIGKIKEDGLSVVPLNLHLKRGKIKADIALVRGKKKHDKRRTIEERQWKRQQGRILKRGG